MFEKKIAKAKYTEDFNALIKNVMFNSIGFFFLEFIIPIYAKQELAATGLEVGFLFSIQTIGFLISSFLAGYLVDKLESRKKLILLGSIGRGIAYFILYFGIAFRHLILMDIGTFNIGFFAGFFWIPFDTIIAEKSHKDHRSFAYGKRDSAVGIGLFFGSILGFGIYFFGLELFPENLFIIYSSVIIYGISNFYAGIQFHYKVDESTKYIDSEKNIDNTTLSHQKEKVNIGIISGFVFFNFVILLASINGTLAKPFLNIYAVEVIVNDPTIASYAYIPSGIVAMYLAPKLGKLIDKIKPYYSVSIISILGAIVTFGLINTDNFFVFALLLSLDTAVVNLANLLVQNIYSRVSIGHRGKVMSSYRFFMSSGSIIGPILGGITLDFLGLQAPFLISILVELSLIPIYLFAIYLIKPRLTESFEENENIAIEKI